MKCPQKRVKPTLDLLRAWLLQLALEEATVERAIAPLRTIQQVRSKGPAHRRDGSCRKMLAKAGLAGISNSCRVLKMMQDATCALRELEALLMSKACPAKAPAQ